MGQKYLMDSNAVIDFFIGSLPLNGKQLISSIEPAISVITQIELFCSNNINPQELLQLQKFVSIAIIYNTIDEAIVTQTINIRKAHKIKTPDAIIAATTLVYNLTLITRNTTDFKNIDRLITVNPHEL